MESCFCNGKELCAYDVTNIHDILNYEIYKKWKIEGEKGNLKCPGCGREVILKVKDPKKKTPHFAHKLKSNCSYNDTIYKESEEHKRGKLKIYHYFKERYEHVYINRSFSNKRRCDVYVEVNNKKLAVEFQRKDLDIIEWKKRHEYYKDNDINDLWFISGNVNEIINNEKQIRLSEIEKIMLNECNKIAIYLDIEEEKLCMVKNMRYRDEKIENNDSEKLFSQIYSISDIVITPEGIIQCDFYNKYEKAYNTYLKEKEEESIRILEYMEKEKKKAIEQVKKKKEYMASLPRVENNPDKQMKNRYTRNQFQIGTKIIHRTFGEAVITKIEEPFVIIQYDYNKEKRISLNICLKGIIVKLIE